MNHHLLIAEVLERQERRREERRRFLKAAGATSAAIAGSSFLAACGGDDNGEPGNVTTPPPANSDPSDEDILNFALNLEYLEASFYAYATTGDGLDQGLLGGTGTQGQVTPGRKVNFTKDPLVGRYANEIAKDEREHVAFLRKALGNSAVASPAIDLGYGANNAFSVAARAAGIITGANDVFDPYSSPNNFLLAAFLFEDVGVTAYKGVASLIDNAKYLSAAAGILAAEAYHAGLIRTTLYRKGIEQQAAKPPPSVTLIDLAGKISDARDTLDGPGEDDQGIAGSTTGTGDNAVTVSSLVPTDGNAIVFSRSTGQVLDIVYLSSASVTKGGFFPNGVNGAINAGMGTTVG